MILIFSDFGVSKYTKDVIDLDIPSGQIQTMLLFDDGATTPQLQKSFFQFAKVSKTHIESLTMTHFCPMMTHSMIRAILKNRIRFLRN